MLKKKTGNRKDGHEEGLARTASWLGLSQQVNIDRGVGASGVGSLRSRCQRIWFLVRDNSWRGDGHFYLCPYEANGEQVSSLPHHAAAAAAKLLQSCLILCDSMDGSPPRLLCPWDSPG